MPAAPEATDPRLAKVKAASLTDAVGRLYGHRAHILDLATPTPGRILFGPAATIQFVARRDDLRDDRAHDFARLFYEALGAERAGKVLVLGSSGHEGAALAGGGKLSRLQNHGLAGALIDGRVRDFDEVRAYDFATYCWGETTRAGGHLIMPWAANVPISMGGVTIVPGDHVYADGSGAVIIPGPDVDRVLDEACEIEDEDATWIERIRDEDPDEVLKGGSGEK